MSQPGSPAAGGTDQGEEMLLRLLQGQQEQLIRLQEMVGAQMQGQQQLTAVTQSVAAASNSRPRGLIDVKAVGRPNPLGGTLEEASRNWRQWSYRLELWLASQFPEARQILGWARERGENEIPLASLESTSITGVARESLLEFNRQLEVVLGTLTVEAPGDVTMNSSVGSGLDMYRRRLHMRLDPSDMVTSMRWLRGLMSTHPVDSVAALVPAIEKWEDAHRRYGQRKDCRPLEEQQQMVSLLGLAPPELQGHLELNLGRLTTYELLRREMVSFADTKRAFTATDGAVPMEVDEMKGKKGPKGKGKDQGGKAKETRQCFICQRKGHLAQDCWYRDKSNQPKGGKAQGSKGSGKGKKGQPTGRAHELEGTESEAMAYGDGEEPYPTEGEQDEAELGFVGALEGDDNTSEEESEGDGAVRHTPGSASTDPMPKPAPKAKVGTTSSTAVGLRMADTSVLNKLTERRRELVQQLEEERARGKDADHGEISKLNLMISQLNDQIERAKTLKATRAKQVSARLKADLDAGYNPRLAKKKEKSRQRAARHRQSLRAGQAKKRVRREEALEKRFNVPEKARKQDEYPLIPGAGSKIAAPPSRREKAMMKGDAEDREHSGDELDKPKERDWTLRPRVMTPERRAGKAKREAKRRARNKAKMEKEEVDEGNGTEPVRPVPEPKTPPRSPKKRPVKKGRRKGADDDLEMDPVPKGKMKPPEPEGPPPKKSHLTEVVFTFKDGSGAVVRRMFNELTPRQRTRVQKALAKAPWREKRPRTTSVQREQRPAVNRQSELFKRTVSYLKGVRPAVPEDRIRRQGLAKQFNAARRFRERVGIRKRLMKTVPRGTAGEFIAKQALDDESDCGSCQSRRRKAKHPADMYYRNEQPGYDDDTDDSDPGHRLGKGPRSRPRRPPCN